MDSAFIADHRERDCINKLMKGSQFSDDSDREKYNAYLKSESDRIALVSKELHLENFVSNVILPGMEKSQILGGPTRFWKI